MRRSLRTPARAPAISKWILHTLTGIHSGTVTIRVSHFPTDQLPQCANWNPLHVHTLGPLSGGGGCPPTDIRYAQIKCGDVGGAACSSPLRSLTPRSILTTPPD